MTDTIKFTQKNFIRAFTDNFMDMAVVNRHEIKDLFVQTLNYFGISDMSLEIFINPLTYGDKVGEARIYSVTLFKESKSSQFNFIEDQIKASAALFFQCCDSVRLFDHCRYGTEINLSNRKLWEKLSALWSHKHYLAPILGNFDLNRLEEMTDEQNELFDQWLTDRRRDPMDLSDEKQQEYRERLKQIFALQDDDFE